MTPEGIKSSYRRMLERVGEPVLVRRYTGTGTTRPRYEVQANARIVDYDPQELAGTIQQGDRRVIVLAQDLIDGNLWPVTPNDKVVVRNKELQIIGIDDSTRRVDTVPIAIEIQVRG